MQNTIALRNIKVFESFRLGESDLDIQKHKRLIERWGDVYPVYVSEQPKCGLYDLIAGYPALKAYESLDRREIPVVFVPVKNEADRLLASIQLSERPGSLFVAETVSELLNNQQVSRHEVLEELRKSKSWLSGMEDLARLEEPVKEMVLAKILKPAIAMQIARLPMQQTEFAINACKDHLTQSQVRPLVRQYLDAKTVEEQQVIVRDPVKALVQERQPVFIDTPSQLAGLLDTCTYFVTEARRALLFREDWELRAVSGSVSLLIENTTALSLELGRVSETIMAANASEAKEACAPKQYRKKRHYRKRSRKGGGGQMTAPAV